MRQEQQIVIRFLQGLGDCVQLPFVRTGVVRLGLARNRSNEVGMDAQGKALHVDSFLMVAFPIAALLAVIDAVDNHIVLLLAVRRNIEGREPHLSGVLRSGKKLDDALLFLVHASLHLDWVGNALGFENAFPILISHLDMVFYRSGVFKFRFLGCGDELLDIIPKSRRNEVLGNRCYRVSGLL